MPPVAPITPRSDLLLAAIDEQFDAVHEARTGPLRVTNADALLPTLLDGLAIAELPEFIAGEYLADGRLEAILPDWSLTTGGLYFVTPSARARPAKVTALSDYFAEHLGNPVWRWPK